MDRYYLEDRTIHSALDIEHSGRTPERILHLTADGMVREVSQIPVLGENEGLLMYVGEFYIELLEVQIEFIKAASAENWLEGLLQRHAERVREIADSLFVLAEIREVPHES